MKAESDENILKERIDQSVKLTVSYSVSGSEVQKLSLNHSAIKQEVEVSVNNENLCWNLESNREWCVVVPGEHKGTGKVILDIAANESFDAREEATLTFVAGEYRSTGIKVNQSASAFIIGQPYFVAPKAGDSYTVNITTLEGTEWTADGGSWLSVSKGSPTTSGGFTKTPLTITPSANNSDSRFGAVTLTAGAETDKIYFWQFGTDLSYGTDGGIFFDKTEQAVLHLTAPAYTVKEVRVPKYASASVTENGDGTSTVEIALEENFSDCNEIRQTDITLLLNNASASVVTIPTITQDYVPANGLVTGKGLVKFAQAVKEGTSTTDWERNGVVTMLQDIDMNGITGWEGIGTADKPFSGTFDGGGFSVNNLKNTASGLFNYCKNATVKNVTMGSGCSVYYGKSYGDKGYLGGIVSFAEGTKLTGCSFSGTVEYAGSSDNDDTFSYVGGIAGWADAASVIQGAGMSGKVVVSTSSASDVTLYAGGVAGLCEGSVSTSEVMGQVSFASGIGTAYVGGIQGALVEGASATTNAFMGKITVSGNAEMAAVGGLYGRIDSDRAFDSSVDKSVPMGSIQINEYRAATTTRILAGGFAGLAKSGTTLSFKGYEVQTNVTLDFSVTALTADNICVGGILGGCETSPVTSLKLEEITTSGLISAKYNTGVTCPVRKVWLGGAVGYVNGPATFKDCTNKGEVGKYEGGAYCARSNGYGEIAGGIAGYAHGGNISFDNCINNANISNHLYNNNGTTGTSNGMYTPPCSGGILGAFNYGTTTESYTLTLNKCVNGNDIFSYRGYTGGIVGFCVNANITSCSNKGRLSNGTNDQNAYRGGIAGAAGNATIKDSWAICDIFARVYGSADYGCAGGILGLVRGDAAVKVQGCAYFGTLKASKEATTKEEFPGGIIGMGSDNCTVADCKYGGSVQGVEITENNVATATNVVGNGLGNISGITYWNGNL
jgi:hypothetical protein